MKLFVLGLAVALGFNTTASADCLDVATRAIEQKGIADWDRSGQTPIMERVTMPQNIVTGYRAWFRVSRCERGYVVVNMQTTCAVTDIWAQGDCDPEIRDALTDPN